MTNNEMTPSTLTLFRLHEHLRRVVALNYQQPLWVTAEIVQVGQSRGHFYLDLVQKGDDGNAIAQAQAILWAADHRRIRAALGPNADAVLRPGLQVRLQIRVDFHERYGLKLHVTDLDPAHTFGQLEIQRQQTLLLLRQAGLLDRNRSLPLPFVLQRVAVVSSEGAAGFQDFREHLEQNPLGYRFHCQLFNSSVQGDNAAVELKAALTEIAFHRDEFDCAVVIRGGGARLDLAAFDDAQLCQTVALMPLPVLTGIGHETDETVLDLVAHTALKTPTAVADFLLQHHLIFENQILRAAENLRFSAHFHLNTQHIELERCEATLRWSSRERIATAARHLGVLESDLPRAADQILRAHAQQLTQVEAICAALHPDQVLRRGYSVTTRNGHPLRSATEVKPGDVLHTRWHDGSVNSKILEDNLLQTSNSSPHT